MSQIPRMNLHFASRKPSHCTRVKRGTGDLLVQNDPFNREYHVTVCGNEDEPLYDLPVRAEPRGAVALAIDTSGRIALIEQWRPVPNSDPSLCTFPISDVSSHGFVSLEAPRGFPERGECGADAARRETCEELGVNVLAVRPLGWLNFNTSIMMNDVPLYAVLMDCEETGHLQADAHEAIGNLSWWSLEELGEKVVAGDIRCGITLAAISYAFASRKALDRLVSDNRVEQAGHESFYDVVGDGMLFVERAMAMLWELGLRMEGISIRAIRYCVDDASGMEWVLEKMRGIGEVKSLKDGMFSVHMRESVCMSGFNVSNVIVSIRESNGLHGLDVEVGEEFKRVVDQVKRQASIGHCVLNVTVDGIVKIIVKEVEIGIVERTTLRAQ